VFSDASFNIALLPTAGQEDAIGFVHIGFDRRAPNQSARRLQPSAARSGGVEYHCSPASIMNA
jgi:hypothetical protein